MRRHINTLLSVVICSIALASCQGFLYVEPTNQTAIASFDDVRAVMGAHLRDFKTFQGGTFQGAVVPFVSDPSQLILSFYAGDIDLQAYMDTYFGDNNRKDIEGALQWQHPDLHTNLWSRNYKNIGFYNMILEELHKFSSGDISLDNQVSGEARVLRAWTFFHLVQLFVPYGVGEMGLPLNTSPETVSTYDASRPPQSENYDFITSELEDVLVYEGDKDEEYGLFYDDDFIHAILAQVYLYKGGSAVGVLEDYEKALTNARAALSSGVDFRIYDRHVKDGTMGFNPDNGFALFDMVRPGFNYSNLSGRPPYVNLFATEEMMALYPDNDLRKKVYFDPENDYAIMKPIAKQLNRDEYVLFSGAELKLIVVEALARLGREDEAKAELREFAATRYETGTEPPYGARPVLELVLEERRKEFFLEGDINWIDKARTGTTITHPALDDEDGSAYTLEMGDFRYTLPIPKSGELNKNKIPQNPGWGSF